MIGRLVQSDLPQPSAEGQWVAQGMKLAPRAQKDLLCKIVYVARRYSSPNALSSPARAAPTICRNSPVSPAMMFSFSALSGAAG
jgi:hydroxyacyl-ACP dehydratase HTD2-like protein with hotdog domain